jgi:hypothetical protein
MGTSQSSGGAPPGVPMVPPWTPPAPQEAETNDAGTIAPSDSEPAEGDPSPPKEQADPGPSRIAPAGRWSAARRNLGAFARTGDSDAMRRGVGQFVRNGYGGGSTAVRRFGGTSASAVALYNSLGVGGEAGEGRGPSIDRTLLTGQSANVIIDAVIESIRPTDGTQDTEAARASVHDALSEVLTRYPEADLLNLSQEEREFAVEQFIAIDVFRRFDLDVGTHIRESAQTSSVALARMREVRDYIRQTVAAAFRALRSAGQNLSSSSVTRVVNRALRDALQVFEGYA